MSKSYNTVHMRHKKNKIKNEQGSVTLFVLVAMIFFLAIAISSYGLAMKKIQGQNDGLERIKAAYGHNMSEEELEASYKKVIGNKDENGCYIESSTIDGGEPSYKNPTIPAGFKPVNTDTSSWGNGKNAPTENDVNAGLVIEDKDGNQFVWIPVDGTNLKYEKHTYATPSVDDTTGSIADTGNGEWRTYYYRNYNDWIDAGGNSNSVSTYGGFYIARYEAGVPTDANFYATKDGDQYCTSTTSPSKNITAYVPVSKAGNQAWNYISQENALDVAKRMYENSMSVTSHLVDGYAWDTVTTWLSNLKHNVADSTSWGNYQNASFTIDGLYALHSYSNNAWTVAPNYNYGEYTINSGDVAETATGITERNKANNIYDFAGNIWEWTTETGKHNETSTTYAVLRSGSCGSNGSIFSAFSRHGSNTTFYTNFSVGFRIVLYLK